MTEFTAKIVFQNSKSLPHMVQVEPWGADFTLLPKERLEVVAYGSTVAPRFELIEHADATQVYCNEAHTFEVFQEGRLLLCGHNRQPSHEA